MPDYAPGPSRKASEPSARRSPAASTLRGAAPSTRITDGRPSAQRLEALQAVASRPLRNGVVQRAGTKPNVASTDGRYRIKLSSAREEFTYDKAGVLGLQAILPGSYPVVRYGTDPAGLVTSVDALVAGAATTINLSSPIDPPAGGKRLLVIDTVGYEAPVLGVAPSQKLFIDVKIGTYTKSGEQFALEGAPWLWRQIKKIEHNIKDSGLDRGSRTTGYDVDKGNADAFEVAYRQALATPAGSPARTALRDAMQAVVGPLAGIQAAILASPVRFVGASLFFVLNLTNPANSDVKLIDPDHPIIDGIRRLATGPVPPDVMTDQSSGKSPSDWRSYVDKWEESFDSGVGNFVKDWFHPRKNSL